MGGLVESAEELRADRAHGGSWLARRAAETLLTVIEAPAGSSEELYERLQSAARRLADARPAMGAITHIMGRLVASAHTARHLPPDELRRLVTEETHALIAGRERAAASIAVHLSSELEDATVLTHSASATVREAVLHTPPARVLCTASAPVQEGRRFARTLREEGVNADLVDEERIADTLGLTTLVLVGADTIYADGSVKNKIGTRPLAEAAARAGVPFIVASELLKLAPIPPPATLAEPDLRDVTPPDLVAALVTEEGASRPEDVPVLIDRTPFLRDGYRLLREE